MTNIHAGELNSRRSVDINKIRQHIENTKGTVEHVFRKYSSDRGRPYYYRQFVYRAGKRQGVSLSGFRLFHRNSGQLSCSMV